MSNPTFMEDVLTSRASHITTRGRRTSIWFGVSSQPAAVYEGPGLYEAIRVYAHPEFYSLKSCGHAHKSLKAAMRCLPRLARGWNSRAPEDCDSWVEIVPSDEAKPRAASRQRKSVYLVGQEEVEAYRAEHGDEALLCHPEKREVAS